MNRPLPPAAHWPGEVLDPEQYRRYRRRGRILARTLYRQLRAQGFSDPQVIELVTEVLDYVHQELTEP